MSKAALMLPCVILLHCSLALAQSAAPAAPAKASTPPAPTPPKIAPAAPADLKKPADQPLPHITVDRAKRTVDIEAVVCRPGEEWLELVLCYKGTRDYEALLSTLAAPHDVHLALLLIGIKPGTPFSWRQEGDKVVALEPTGEPVLVTLLYEHEGKTHSLPANQWVHNQLNEKVLAGETWLFSGSKFEVINEPAPGEDKAKVVPVERYGADLDGTIISLVNFGTDVLSRPTKQTNDSDGGEWAARRKIMPPAGTKVIVRLQPAPKPEPQPQANVAPEAPKASEPAKP